MESEDVSRVGRALVATALALVMSGLPGAAGAMARDKEAPIITHVKVLQTPLGEDVIIRARFEDESEIFAPSVYYRRHGEERYVAVEMVKADEGWRGVIPASEVTGPLEYFIEAFDSEGNGPAREGLPEEPIPIAVYAADRSPTPPIAAPPQPPPPPPPDPELVPPPPPPPVNGDDDGIVSQWWFWTGIGVVLTGAVVTTVLLTRGDDPVSEVAVEVVGPDPTARLP